MSDPFLSVVVPSYRQAATICQELTSLNEFLETIVPSHEIILVIDGNSDSTLEQVTANCQLDNLSIECLPRNLGKGAAVKHGFSCARGQLIGFIDSGGDLDYKDLTIMLAEMKLHQADIVIGSKRHSLSTVSYPLQRHLYSRVYQLINRLLFRLRIRDTQVGMKVFRREVLQAILPHIVVKQFAFDLELLVVAYHLGFTRIVEAPIKLKHNFSSSVSWRSVYQTLWDTLAIFYRLHILHWYNRPIASPAPAISSPITLTIHRTTKHAKLANQTTVMNPQPVATSKSRYIY